VILLIVHAGDSAIHRKERPLETTSDGAVEILSLVFGHFKDDFFGIANLVLLKQKHNTTL
jgi:hypothetical protein